MGVRGAALHSPLIIAACPSGGVLYATALLLILTIQGTEKCIPCHCATVLLTPLNSTG